MIIHDKSDAAKYFVKGLDYVKHMPPKKNPFSRHTKAISNEELMTKNYTIIIGTTKKGSIDFISESISQKQSAGVNIDNMIIVIVDYFKDSMIRSKYIKGKVLRGHKTNLKPIFIFVEFDVMNTIIQIEDEYNQCFSYKELSRHYLKQLQSVHDYCKALSLDDMKSHQKNPIKKGGNDIANSSLV